MTAKDRYRKLCEEEPTIPIFSRDWWLDAVCGDAWDVCLVEKGGRVMAAMPYYITRRYGFSRLTQPKLTQTLGPWLRPSDASYAKRLGQEKELLTALATRIPDFALFRQNWHHANTNWLPFYWHGFRQTTRYTYRLPDLAELDAVWSGFRENIRREIRKAETRYRLQVRRDVTIDEFLALNAQAFERQGMALPYSQAFVKALDRACASRAVRQSFVAEDPEGRQHAGVYIVWDEQSAYYLMGGGDPELRVSGATSLCLWEAIQFAAEKTRSFDFEGSMLEPVERFFRAFGAIQTPYFTVYKTQSRALRAVQAVRAWLRD
jgi:hypothetical protein